MKNMKNQKGITLVELVITIVVMMILIISITTSISSTLGMKKYYAVKEDIIVLTEAVQKYYVSNGNLPGDEIVSFDIDTLNSKDKNPNDNNVYYKIDITKLTEFDSTITLNNKEDNYLVNEQSFTIYYENGVKLDGEVHYTIIDEFSGGAFAEDYYANTDLPIISAVTLESNGEQSNRASVGDIVTLKMIANYTFTTEPTIKINNTEVTATWEGRVGKATYTITLEDAANKDGEKIQINISNYQADGKDGKEITDVTFGKGVSIYAKTLVELYKEGYIQTGDWVNYQNPTTIAADVKSTDENYTDTSYTSLGSRTGMSLADGWEADIDQTYSLTNNGKQVNWRVLGLSEDGTQLMLTTGSPLQRDYNISEDIISENSPYFWLSGAKGTSTEYGIKELNKICAIYKNNLVTEARSITISDINRLCKVKVDVANGKVTTERDTTTNFDGYGNIGKTQTYENQYASPEDYIEGKGTTASFSKTSDTYAYLGNEAINESSTLYDVLFARTGQTGEDWKYYWLASRSVRIYSDNCRWDLGVVKYGDPSSFNHSMFFSDGGWSCNIAAVRPVVYLRSDVTIADLNKLETAPTAGEEAWDYTS